MAKKDEAPTTERNPVYDVALALAKANKHPEPDAYAARVVAFHAGENPDEVPAEPEAPQVDA